MLLCIAVTCIASLLLVMTANWHGRVSMDSSFGIQKLHIEPTPRIGGVAITLGLFVGYLNSSVPVQSVLGPMLLASVPAFAVGLWEDLTKTVPVRIRLLATMSSGVLAWLLTGIAMQDTGLWGLDNLLSYLPMGVAFTAFVVSGVANATNIIDGFNGLAAGVVAIMLAAMGFIAMQVGDTVIATLAFTIASVALGFGAVNWPWGKIFMGDGGAYLLGFMVAWVAILLPMKYQTINGWATLLACAYPVLEVLYSIRRRLKRSGSHPGQPDKCHLHHFLHRRLIRKLLPRASRTIQNGMTGSLVWILAAIPSAWAVAFYDDTKALTLGFLLAGLGYMSIYSRLTQFVWCFQPATLHQPKSNTA